MTFHIDLHKGIYVHTYRRTDVWTSRDNQNNKLAGLKNALSNRAQEHFISSPNHSADKMQPLKKS